MRPFSLSFTLASITAVLSLLNGCASAPQRAVQADLALSGTLRNQRFTHYHPL